MKIFEAISSVLNGNPSKEEQLIFDDWISENDTNKNTYEYLLKIKAKSQTDKINWDKERVWNLTRTKIRELRYKKTIFIWRSVAAVIAIMLTLSSLLYFYNNNSHVAQITTTTPRGIRTTVELPDGSMVYLNAGTRFNYPSVFNGKERRVNLVGEAYFEIAKDTDHPFIVTTGEVEIKVLGTKFNLKSYQEDDEITTTLLEGKVSLGILTDKTQQKPVVLKPNYLAAFNKSNKSFQVKKVSDVLAYTAWKEGSYFFDNEQFFSIMQKLERGFNINIKIHIEELKHERYSGMFDNGENLNEILDIMKFNREFDYYTSKDTLHIINKSMSNKKK